MSLNAIFDNKKPNVATINETNLKGKKVITMPGYKSVCRNRADNKHMGGVATLVKKSEIEDFIKVGEGADLDEYLVTRHSQFLIPINIVNVYGEIENRFTREQVEDRFDRICEELNKIELRGEQAILIGDMNKHVGDIIEGNSDKITFGGQLIRDLLKSNKYLLVNSSNKVIGGPHTRYDPANPHKVERKSCLDLVIVSRELSKNIEKLTIDKRLKMTPCRPLSRAKLVYTDHYSLELIFKNLPLKSGQVKAEPTFRLWNTNKEGGWEKYTAMTTDNGKLEEVAADDSEDPDRMMNSIDKELNRIKYASFGKVKVRNKPKTSKELEKLQKEKIKCFEEVSDLARMEKVKEIDEQIAENLLVEQRKLFEKELKSLKEQKINKGKAAVVFSLKSKVVGSKKSKQEATVLIDYKTNKEVDTPEEIKRVSIDYCEELLTNRAPKEDFEEDLEFKQIIHKVRMEEEVENDIEFSPELFDKSLKILSKKSGGKYNFIAKGGPSLKSALYNLFKTVWEKEQKPDKWRNTILLQLYKGRGPRGDLNNQRNIHTKQDIPKFFGHIVASAA